MSIVKTVLNDTKKTEAEITCISDKSQDRRESIKQSEISTLNHIHINEPPVGAVSDCNLVPVNILSSDATKKANKSKRTKKNTEINDSVDQLNLAQSHIGNLERKILDLENSNKILKQGLQLNSPCTGEPTRNINHFTREQPKNEIPVLSNNYPVERTDLSLLKEKINLMEVDILKYRLNALESSMIPLSTHRCRVCFQQCFSSKDASIWYSSSSHQWRPVSGSSDLPRSSHVQKCNVSWWTSASI